MAKFEQQSNKLRTRNILLAILPAFIVASLVYSANIYFDLDAGIGGKIMTWNQQEFKSDVYVDGTLGVVGTSTLGIIDQGTWQGTAIGAQYGGTGLSSFIRGDILVATSTSEFYRLAAGSDGYVLTISGDLPVWQSLTAQGLGAVTGTGTINYLARWSTSSTLEDSIIYNDGTYVGIGTSTPSSILDIYASSSATATALTVTQEGSGNIVDFKNATGSVFTIASSGNVSVAGNILPVTTEQYDLGSNTYKWDNVYASLGTLDSFRMITGASPNYVLTSDVDGFGTWNELTAEGIGATGGSGTINYLARWSGSTTLGDSIIYDNDGLGIGIGTESPSAMLDIYDDGANQLRLSYNSSNYTDFSVNSGGNLTISPSGELVSIRTVGSQSYFRIYGSGDNYMEFTYSANSTSGKLYVSEGDIEIGSYGAPIYLEYATFLTASSTVYTALTVTQEGSGDIADFQNATGSVFNIANNGNITMSGGIILTADEQYDLGSETYKWANIYSATGTFWGFQMPTGASSTYVLTSDASGIGTWQNLTLDFVMASLGSGGTANYLAKWSATTTLTDSIIYDSGTHIGIGTSDPLSILDVYASSSATATALTVTQEGSGNIVDFKNATGSVFTIANTGNITVAGNILPATTTAYSLGSETYKWANIYSATSVMDAFKMPTGASSTYVLTSDASGIGTWQSLTAQGLGAVTGTGTINYLAKWSASSTLEDSIIYDSGTHIGIGTSTPSSILDVYASSSATATALTVTQEGSGNIVDFKNATSSVFTIANTGNITVAGNILPATTTAYSLGSETYKWANIYAATGTFGDGTITIGTDQIIGSATTTLFTTGNANQLVLGANGNIGIGTDSSTAKLMIEHTGSGDAFKIYDKASDLTPFRINDSGYVHINRTSLDSASVALNVNGGIYMGEGDFATLWGGFGSYENYLKYSEQFDNSVWVTSSISVTANTTTAPNGLLVADQLTALITSTSEANIYQECNDYISSPDYVIFSAWIKNNNATTGNVAFKLSVTGAGFGSFFSQNFSIEDIIEYTDNQWVRFRKIVTLEEGQDPDYIKSEIQLKDFATNTSVYVWGAQLTTGHINTYTPIYVSTEDIPATTTNYGLTVGGPGNHYFASGNVGIGTPNPEAKLTVFESGSGNIVDFKNATGSVFTIIANGNVGIGTSTPGYLLTVDTGSTSTVGIAVEGSIIASGSIESDTGLDIAERFSIDPQCWENNDCPEAGDLVSIKENEIIEKTLYSYDSKLIGVVSENPAIIMGGRLNSADSLPVALAGRLPVKVSIENGPIQIGNLLTSASSTPGMAMKSTEPGRVIGIALENFDGTQGETGRILVFVNPHWSIGSLSDNGLPETKIFVNEDTEEFSVLDQFTLAIKNSLQKLGFFIESGIARLQKLFVREICLEGEDGETVCLNKDQLKQLLEEGGDLPFSEDEAQSGSGPTGETQEDESTGETQEEELAGETQEEAFEETQQEAENGELEEGIEEEAQENQEEGSEENVEETAEETQVSENPQGDEQPADDSSGESQSEAGNEADNAAESTNNDNN